MADAAEILREIADENARSASARAHFARMADGNAHRPNLPPKVAQRDRETAERARADAAHFEARAAAATAGAEALEARRGG